MKDTLTLKENINIIDHYDVIVLGGGTAGSVAGSAAARLNAKTLIIESEGALGGTSTVGQVTPMMPVEIEGNPDSSAFNKEIKKRLIAEGYGAKDSNGNDGWFNPEMLKHTLEDIYLEYNGDILYDCEFVKPIVENDTIKGVIVYNKNGLEAYTADQFIDATGDALVAYRADVPCKEGSKEDKYQAVSLRFTVSNIELKKFTNFLSELGQDYGLEYPLVETAMVWGEGFALEKIFLEALESGDLKKEDGKYFQAFSIPGMPTSMYFNCPEIPGKINSLDPKELTEARIKGRKMMKRLYNFFVDYLPGFNTSFIASEASIIGIRESRRIVGEYVLDSEDYQKRRKFPDAIANSAYPIDIHGDELELKEVKKGEYYQIPYRTLIPKNITNLLVTGKSISSTFTTQAAIRIQSICRATGEAAGIAAAMAVKENITVRDIDGKKIKEQMLNWGADI
ncbi:MAG TPA: FAD-dependent oxidoreductase [Halanaerobiales bacterium]|nr:FAD-dependent oxidoreductase [Halanaerobiales bacterium]